MPKRKAAIYARYSTDLQKDRSIDDQVALCRSFATKNDVTISKVYADRAQTSASIIGRDGIMQLMDDAKAGLFDMVIVEALDRISRDQEDLAGIYKRLSFANVEIVAVHDGVADAVQIGIRGLVGSLFMADLKHKVRRGLAGVISDGRSAGGRAYGYRPILGRPGELEIIEHEADAVRRIFQLYVDGDTPRDIAKTLNEEKVPPPRGGSWNASTINGSRDRGNGILLNPLYHGKIVWNRVRMVRDPDTGRRVSRINPESEWKTADAPHLAIIDPAIADAAAKRREQRSFAQANGRNTQRPKRLLSGLMKCGVCGGGMSMHDKHASGAIRIRCSTNRESGSCTNIEKYRLDLIERAVVDRLRDAFSNPAYLEAYIQAYVDERQKALKVASRNKNEIERQLADATGQLSRLLDLFARGIVGSEGIEDKIIPLQERIGELKERLKAADAEIPKIDLHPQAVKRYQSSIANLHLLLGDPEPRQHMDLLAAVRQIISHVVVHPKTKEGATVEIFGLLSALIGKDIPELGEVMVAKEGFEPPTQGL